MRKRILSLLIVLSLCLGLLPVTALAAAPDGQVIYIGNENVTSGGYWTTDSKGNVTAYTDDGTTPSDNYIHYDKEANTLTLYNATIKKGLDYDEDITGGTSINDAAIGVFNQSGAAELTIILYGSNTIAEVGKGIYVLANSRSTGSSSLTIMGNGSLDTSSSQTGIWVQSNSNNAALCVKNAEVTASADGAFKNGVLVQAKEGSDVSLTVNGGSLTASVNANIWFQFGSGASGSGTPTVTVSNNAIVRANGGIANNSSSPIQYKTGSDSTGGIVFDGNTGTVYGKVELQEDLEIGEGESLTLDDGANLSAGDHNVIVDGGTLDESLANSLGDSVKYAPAITNHPKNVEVKENETATFTVKVTGTEPLSYQWQQSTDNGSSWTDITGETNATYTIATTTMDMNGTQYRCVVKNSIDEATSNAATLTVTAIPTYSITVETDGNGTAFASQTSAPEGTLITLTAVPNSGYHFDRFEVVSGNITITNNTFTMPAEPVTVKAVFDRDSSGGAHHPDAGSTTTASSDRYEIETPSDVENGSIKVSPSKAEKGDTVTVTVTPDDGYQLDKLAVYDEDGDKLDLNDKGDGKFTFQMPKGNVSIEVSFAPIEDETADFSDVLADAWYAEAVQYVYENGLMTGTSDTTFSPDLTTSRSMIATILWRMAGSPVVNYAMDFADVPADQWYAEAVRWASSEGIVGGYGNGSFGTGDPITREQFAVMLYRFAQKQGYDVSVGENTNILSYTDVSSVSEYAIPAMQWAVGSGVITGMGDTLAPQGETTRAQAAMMLMRFCEQYA
ncbi:S-layer homology domain-containing protein [Butyricicoccus pullicaecorum]|uniref:S-layer homology domain-containing protein n=1 Tax=Butyricicoccus pullicaecorum TaxID=501571 RepID=UPI003990D445